MNKKEQEFINQIKKESETVNIPKSLEPEEQAEEIRLEEGVYNSGRCMLPFGVRNCLRHDEGCGTCREKGSRGRRGG